MPARLIGLVLLSAVTASAVARAEDTPLRIACHREATQRYIAGFQQTGIPQLDFDGYPIVVTVFQNDTTRYDEYYAECMKRAKSETSH